MYGIYNLPLYAKLVLEDNDPIAFLEFLRVANHPAYQDKEISHDMTRNVRTMNDKYPTRKMKEELIQDWWAKKRGEFSNLGQLQATLDALLKREPTDSQPATDM